MAVVRGSGARGIGTLLRELVEDSAALARAELRLAKTEISELADGIGRGTARVAIGAVVVLLGGLAFVAGLVLLIGDQWLPADRYWVAALIMMAITGTLAAWLAKRGLSLVSPVNLAPKETASTLREDTAWLKHRLTSDTTSS